MRTYGIPPGRLGTLRPLMRAFQEQREVLRSNAAEVIPSDEFDLRLKSAIETDRPLKVKLGVDPTAGDVTLGWTVVLRKLRQFQDMGHTAVLILGDFTAMVGDPSGRSETRVPMTAEQARRFGEEVLGQLRLVLDEDRLEIRRNSEWLAGMDMADVLGLTSHYTVARMLERDDFAKRFEAGSPISIMEFLYPLLQGYDSVAVEADVELGGTDQTFNLLVGRAIQQRYDQEPQCLLTMPLIEGLDGSQKMSQSLGNYIGVREAPDDMFGKVMSLPDDLIVKYFRLVTDVGAHQSEQIEGGLASGALHPAEAKRRLAFEIVGLYHGEEAADAARERFDLVHRERLIPEEVDEFLIPPELVTGGRVWVPKLLAEAGLAASSSEGRRLIGERGVRIDGEVLEAEEFAVDDLSGKILQVGRRRFVRLTLGVNS